MLRLGKVASFIDLSSLHTLLLRNKDMKLLSRARSFEPFSLRDAFGEDLKWKFEDELMNWKSFKVFEVIRCVFLMTLMT